MSVANPRGKIAAGDWVLVIPRWYIVDEVSDNGEWLSLLGDDGEDMECSVDMIDGWEKRDVLG
jgi:hypothetical protein